MSKGTSTQTKGGPSKFSKRLYCNAACYGSARATGEAFASAGKRRGVWRKCKCPRCEKIHKTRVDWTGRGIPKIYCGNCQYIVADRDYDAYMVVGKSRFYEYSDL